MGGASAGSSSLVAKCIHVFVKVRRCIYSSGYPHTTTITLSSIVSDFLPPLAMTSPLEQAPDWLTRREYPPKFRFFNSRYWRVKVCSHQMRMIYMLSQCKHAKDNPAALFARMRRREWRELKNLNFGGYSQNDLLCNGCYPQCGLNTSVTNFEWTTHTRLWLFFLLFSAAILIVYEDYIKMYY